MSEFNPYAAPQTELSTRPRELDEGGAWCDGNLLVLTKNFDLPDRCLKCNQPTDGWRLKRNLSWHPPVWYALLLINVLLYIMVAMVVRKTGRIAVPLCPAHRRRRRWAIVVGWLTALCGLGLIVAAAGMTEHQEFPLIGGTVLLLFGIIYGVLRSQVAVPKKIDKRLIWLRKVDPAFLAEFPPLPFA
ncbi:MAG: hypothetical protein P4L84_16645 [Isosphaeraceae bacterium]|nr:hypothetical protein [Isosphaeraceae bacterium]